MKPVEKLARRPNVTQREVVTPKFPKASSSNWAYMNWLLDASDSSKIDTCAPGSRRL